MMQENTKAKLLDQIAQLKTQMAELEAKMSVADDKEKYKWSLIYSAYSKQVTNLYTALTRISVAQLELEKVALGKEQIKNPEVVKTATREQVLAELRENRLNAENSELRQRYAG
jgi:hypothetical protein